MSSYATLLALTAFVLIVGAGWILWLAHVARAIGAGGLMGAALGLGGAWHLSRAVQGADGAVVDAAGGLGLSVAMVLGIVLTTPFARRVAGTDRAERERDQTFRSVFNTALDGIVVIDAKGLIESFNPAAEEIFGYSADEVLGRNVSILLPRKQAHLHDGYIKHYRRTGEKKIIGRRRDVIARHKDGSDIPIALAVTEMGAGPKSRFVATVHDISKILIYEERLAEANRLLQSVLDTIPVAVFWKDHTLRYLGCNRVFARDAGLDSPDEIVGMSDADMPWARAMDSAERVERSVISTGEPRLAREEPRQGSGGEMAWLRTSRIPLRDKAGEIIGVLGIYEDITAEFEFREAVLAEKQRVERYLGVSGAMIVELDLNGRVRLINRKGLEILGYREDELVGRDWFETAIPHEMRVDLRHAFDEIARGNLEPYAALESEVVTKSGERRHIVWQNSFESDDMGRIVNTVSSGVDVTNMRRADKMLRDAIESMRDGFALFDSDDRLVLFNSTYPAMFPRAAPAIQPGRTFEEITRYCVSHGEFGDLGGAEEAFIQAHIHSHRNPGEPVELQTSDGRWVRVDERRTDDGGIVGIRSDITRLKQAIQEAEAANAAKSQFLSSMSHELRTPLNAILGFAQLLEDDPDYPLAPEQREGVEQIINSGEHLLGLVGEVLDLTRVESGRLDIDIRTVELGPVLADCVSLLRPLSDRRAIAVDIAADGMERAHVQADKARLRQVLINLLSNAVKYNRHGGRVDVRVEAAADGRLRVEVADTGLGIPADARHAVFEPFARMSAETSSIEGSGIGLSIAKRLVELMDGAIGFDSVEGEGTRFWVELPMAPDAAVPTATASADGAAVAGRTVLYMDDNPVNRQLMRYIVDSLGGVRLVVVDSLDAAVAHVAEASPDVVVLDHAVGGADAVSRLRSASGINGAPIIGIGDVGDGDGACSLDCDVCLVRPVNAEALSAAFREVLGGAA
jgi:PAS domain S-box-containing protein